MALIKCPECGKEISDASTACIHCGYPISKNPDVQKKVKSNIESNGLQGATSGIKKQVV